MRPGGEPASLWLKIWVGGSQATFAIGLVRAFIDQLFGNRRFVLRLHPGSRRPGGGGRLIPRDQVFSLRTEFRRCDIGGSFIRGSFDLRGINVVIFIRQRLLRVHTFFSRHRDEMAVTTSAARQGGDEKV